MPRVGDTVGRYTLEAPLGQGGMGQVFVAVDTALGRKVALKVVMPDADATEASRASFTARMMREARAAAALSHVNAVSVFDVGEFEGAPYIVMELVPGRSLRAYVGDASIPMARRLRWLRDIARALGAAHAAGIVHRDVKPDNVMIREDGVVKMLDFGIAPAADEIRVDPSAPTEGGDLGTLTGAGALIGTPRYMAPEQIKNKDLDGRADQFAWGVTAYELCAGRPPWEGSDALALLAAVLGDDPPALRDAAPEVPEEVDAAIRRALSKPKDDRFSSMEDVADALDPFCDAPAPKRSTPPTGAGRSGEARSVAGATAASPPSSKSGRRVAVVALVLAACTAAVVVGVRGTAPPPPSPDAPTGDAAAPPKVVVLPFENVTRRADDDWLGVGMAEAIEAKLQAAPGVEVMSRRTVAAAGAEKARALGATMMVTGTIQKVGDEIKVSARVEDLTQPGRIVARRDERGTTQQIFDLQDALAVAVAEALAGGSLAKEAQADIRERGTRNLEAFEAYAKGIALLSARKIPEAMKQFQRAIAADPKFRVAQATLNITRAEAHHIIVLPEGIVVETSYEEIPKATDGTDTYERTTNMGAWRKVWDVDGNPLEMESQKALGDETAYTVHLTPKIKGGKRATGIVVEQEGRKPKVFDGVTFMRRGFTTSEGGEQTFVIQLPPKATLLTLVPSPVEMSTEDAGTFLLLRQKRDAYVSYGWGIGWSLDPAIAARYLDQSVEARARWLVQGGLASAADAEDLARAAEPSLVCLAAREGNVAGARAQLRRIEAAPDAFGPFSVARAKACGARAAGDDAGWRSGLEAAIRTKARSFLLIQETYLELLDSASRKKDLAEMERLILLELERAPWWERGLFHQGLAEADAEPKLRALLAADPDDVAARHDLAKTLLLAKRTDDAAALLAGDNVPPGNEYLLVLAAQIARARGDGDALARALGELVGHYPLVWAFATHAEMMGWAGRGHEAIAFMAPRGEDSEYAPPFFAALGRVAARLDAPLADVDGILALVAKAPAIMYGGAYRLETIARVARGASRSRSADADALVARLIEALRAEVAARPEACKKPCLARLGRTLCEVKRISPADRRWITETSGARCEADQ